MSAPQDAAAEGLVSLGLPYLGAAGLPNIIDETGMC